MFENNFKDTSRIGDHNKAYSMTWPLVESWMSLRLKIKQVIVRIIASKAWALLVASQNIPECLNPIPWSASQYFVFLHHPPDD